MGQLFDRGKEEGGGELRFQTAVFLRQPFPRCPSSANQCDSTQTMLCETTLTHPKRGAIVMLISANVWLHVEHITC